VKRGGGTLSPAGASWVCKDSPGGRGQRSLSEWEDEAQGPSRGDGTRLSQ